MASTESSTRVRPVGGPMQVESPGAVGVHTERGGATAGVFDYGAGKLLPWLVLACLLSGAALMGSVASLLYVNAETSRMRSDSDLTRRHVEELRIRTEDNQVLLQISGIMKPGDAKAGPGANPNRLKER